MAELTPDDIVEAAKRCAQERGMTSLSRSDFERLTGISQYHLYRHFPDGAWREVARRAGLAPHPRDKESLPDDDLLAEFHRVASLLGQVPTWHRFAAHSKYAPDTVRKRFGGLDGTLRRYKKWLEQNDPASPLLLGLDKPDQSTPLELTPKQVANVPERASPWPKHSGPEYGAPINFRGLRHAPLNEQGVVYVFGMVAHELGFQVEAIHTSFPDCEAKRSVDARQQRWLRVRIELEFRSRNFLDHAHDVAQCDLIVCWEHDWPACPIDVIELRRVVLDLPS